MQFHFLFDWHSIHLQPEWAFSAGSIWNSLLHPRWKAIGIHPTNTPAALRPADCASVCHRLESAWPTWWAGHHHAVNGGVIPDCRQIAFCAERRGAGRGQNAGQADADIRSHARQHSLAHSWATSYSQDKSQLLQIQYPLLKIITAIRLPAHGLEE